MSNRFTLLDVPITGEGVSPTHTETIRPCWSKATLPHSVPGARYVEVTLRERPSGPALVYVSLMYASSCTLLRPFGAMKAGCGMPGAATGCAAAALPMNAGKSGVLGSVGMGTGWLCADDAKGAQTAARLAKATTMARCQSRGGTPRMRPFTAPRSLTKISP